MGEHSKHAQIQMHTGKKFEIRQRRLGKWVSSVKQVPLANPVKLVNLLDSVPIHGDKSDNRETIEQCDHVKIVKPVNNMRIVKLENKVKIVKLVNNMKIGSLILDLKVS